MVGMFPSEMTDHEGKHLDADKVDAIGKGVTGVAMRRGGVYVSPCIMLSKVY